MLFVNSEQAAPNSKSLWAETPRSTGFWAFGMRIDEMIILTSSNQERSFI
jgi:hypothetical protein